MRRLSGIVCALVLLTAFPASAGFDAAQREEIGTVVREYLLANPDVLEEAGQILQKRHEDAEIKRQAEIMAENQDRFVTVGLTPVLGNPDGDVTVVMFSDYNCGYCRAVAPTLAQVLQEDPKVRLVVREFPILGPESAEAARAALAAWRQGKYAAFHDRLMSGEGPLDPATLETIARDLGLDMTRFEADRTSAAVQAEIDTSHDLGSKLGIRGTPGFIIGSRVYPGALPKEAMQQVIAEVRQSAAQPVQPSAR